MAIGGRPGDDDLDRDRLTPIEGMETVEHPGGEQFGVLDVQRSIRISMGKLPNIVPRLFLGSAVGPDDGAGNDAAQLGHQGISVSMRQVDPMSGRSGRGHDTKDACRDAFVAAEARLVGGIDVANPFIQPVNSRPCGTVTIKLSRWPSWYFWSVVRT